jgi:ATP-dependent DNA ligase
VALPLKHPVEPQLAKSAKPGQGLPEGPEWVYEPKYDGFRAIAFIDGDEVFLQSRTGKPLLRYFPELRFPKGKMVLDGELVILGDKGVEEFNSLQMRLHPAESRIKLLSEQIPARFRAFDLLALDKAKLLEKPFSERRAKLEKLGKSKFGGTTFEVTPMAKTPRGAEKWLASGEGVIAKQIDAAYEPGKRRGMIKVKRVRTLDVVVAGWRPGKEKDTVGSLMLGLYDKKKKLHVIGHTSGFKAKEKRALVKELKPYETGERGSADPSRWDTDRELEWIDLRPELVVEITYDHVSDGRIRHGAKILRWRDDKDPADCSLDQLV